MCLLYVRVTQIKLNIIYLMMKAEVSSEMSVHNMQDWVMSHPRICVIFVVLLNICQIWGSYNIAKEGSSILKYDTLEIGL